MPSRWSSSCWRMRAKKFSAVKLIISPLAVSASMVTVLWRRSLSNLPGTERQPSSPPWDLRDFLVKTGLMSAIGPWALSAMKMRLPTPICGAAMPTPFAWYIVSTMSSSSVLNAGVVISFGSTSLARSRSTGSPSTTIFLMAIGLSEVFWISIDDVVFGQVTQRLDQRFRERLSAHDEQAAPGAMAEGVGRPQRSAHGGLPCDGLERSDQSGDLAARLVLGRGDRRDRGQLRFGRESRGVAARELFLEEGERLFEQSADVGVLAVEGLQYQR